jgi:hypothetical protein
VALKVVEVTPEASPVKTGACNKGIPNELVTPFVRGYVMNPTGTVVAV